MITPKEKEEEEKKIPEGEEKEREKKAVPAVARVSDPDLMKQKELCEPKQPEFDVS